MSRGRCGGGRRGRCGDVRRAGRAASQWEDSDEYCPHCDTHLLVEVQTPELPQAVMVEYKGDGQSALRCALLLGARVDAVRSARRSVGQSRQANETVAAARLGHQRSGAGRAADGCKVNARTKKTESDLMSCRHLLRRLRASTFSTATAPVNGGGGGAFDSGSLLAELHEQRLLHQYTALDAAK